MSQNPHANQKTQSTLKFSALRWLTNDFVREIESLNEDGHDIKVSWTRHSLLYNKITVTGETKIVKAVMKYLQKAVQ